MSVELGVVVENRRLAESGLSVEKRRKIVKSAGRLLT